MTWSEECDFAEQFFSCVCSRETNNGLLTQAQQQNTVTMHWAIVSKYWSVLAITSWHVEKRTCWRMHQHFLAAKICKFFSGQKSAWKSKCCQMLRAALYSESWLWVISKIQLGFVGTQNHRKADSQTNSVGWRAIRHKIVAYGCRTFRKLFGQFANLGSSRCTWHYQYASVTT